MYKVLANCKKVVAAMVLCMIVICSLFSISQATGPSIESGRKYSKTNGYRSITIVSAYEDNGFGKNVRAVASIGSKKTDVTDVGQATAKSGWVSSNKDAWHGYAVGGGSLIQFINNKSM